MDDRRPIARITIETTPEGRVRQVFADHPATVAWLAEDARPHEVLVAERARDASLIPQYAQRAVAEAHELEWPTPPEPELPKAATRKVLAADIGLSPNTAGRFLQWCARKGTHPGKRLDRMVQEFLYNAERNGGRK